MKNSKELAKMIFEEIGSEDLVYIEDKLKEVYKEIENMLKDDDYFTFVDLSEK